MISASKPRITASVTTAPMTPATAFEIPPDEDEDAVAEVELPVEVDVVEAQIPVEFPHLLHQVAWSPMANWFIWFTNVFHGRTVSDCPKSGYAVKGFADAVPLEKRKRTEISSLVG
jgi:hypothetical protein